jgi:hypothetical protein
MSRDAIAVEPGRLDASLGRAVVEFGATVNAALVVIGDRPGQPAKGYVEYDTDSGRCALSPEQAVTMAS